MPDTTIDIPQQVLDDVDTIIAVHTEFSTQADYINAVVRKATVGGFYIDSAAHARANAPPAEDEG